MRQTARPTQLPDPSPPIATHPHPRSSGRRQTPPPPHAVQRVQIPTASRYTLSASGLPLALRQTVVPTRFSQIQRPDAPSLCEISGLEPCDLSNSWSADPSAQVQLESLRGTLHRAARAKGRGGRGPRKTAG